MLASNKLTHISIVITGFFNLLNKIGRSDFYEYGPFTYFIEYVPFTYEQCHESRLLKGPPPGAVLIFCHPLSY